MHHFDAEAGATHFEKKKTIFTEKKENIHP
jgi:hypothetical protein